MAENGSQGRENESESDSDSKPSSHSERFKKAGGSENETGPGIYVTHGGSAVIADETSVRSKAYAANEPSSSTCEPAQNEADSASESFGGEDYAPSESSGPSPAYPQRRQQRPASANHSRSVPRTPSSPAASSSQSREGRSARYARGKDRTPTSSFVCAGRGQVSKDGADPFGEIPFELLDPARKSGRFDLRCDGCGRRLAVHKEVYDVYKNAKNCPFFCSTVGLKRCAHEPEEDDMIDYLIYTVRLANRNRNRKKRRKA